MLTVQPTSCYRATCCITRTRHGTTDSNSYWTGTLPLTSSQSHIKITFSWCFWSISKPTEVPISGFCFIFFQIPEAVMLGETGFLLCLFSPGSRLWDFAPVVTQLTAVAEEKICQFHQDQRHILELVTALGLPAAFSRFGDMSYCGIYLWTRTFIQHVQIKNLISPS